MVELQAELRHKSFELSHLRVVMGERDGLLGQANAQVELLQDKMQVLRDRCQSLEAAAAAGGNASPAPTSSAIVVAAAGERGPPVDPEVVATLRREKALLTSRIQELDQQLQEARSTLAMVGQPHAFLLGQLSAAKARTEAAERRAAAERARAAEGERCIAELAAERDALKQDLDSLLTQRSSLDEMRRVVMRAVGGGGGGGSSALVIQGAGSTTTTILK